MSKVPLKLDEVNAGYPYKSNSILSNFRVFHCISLIYHIIMLFFFFSKNMSESKLKIIEFSMYFINLLHNYAFF